MRIEDYLGPSALERAQRTKLYAMAGIIDKLLYDMIPLHEWLPTLKKQDAMIEQSASVPTRMYVSGVDKAFKIDGQDGDYFETRKALRAIQRELERLAAVEATR